MSHADIARECSHCHVPLHCVTDTGCQDCHIEIARERNDTETLHGRLPGVSRCQNCHPEHRGEDASLTVISYLNVDHFQLAGFSLEKHVLNYDEHSFTCTTCHSQEGNQVETVDCVTCHTTEDHDYMVEHIEAYGMACVACHDGQDRMMAGFDHDAYFPLQDGHADMACADCHANQQTGELTWQDLPSDCLSCHPDPDLHLGMFGVECERCHTAAAWAPAALTVHTFELAHSEENTIEQCENCHAGTYTVYPCESCHTEDEMQLAHQPHGIYEIQDCIACHPTGRPSDTADSSPAVKGEQP